MPEEIQIYTDGSALGAPGKGGCAAIIIYNTTFNDKNIVKKIAGYQITTNNRMELMAVILALQSLNPNVSYNITLYSDSKYLTDCFNKGWMENWNKNGWKTADGKDVKNRDLWDKIVQLMSHHTIEFKWVKGHANNKYNNMCDRLARAEAEKNFNTLKTDKGYLREVEKEKIEQRRKRKKKEERKIKEREEKKCINWTYSFEDKKENKKQQDNDFKELHNFKEIHDLKELPFTFEIYEEEKKEKIKGILELLDEKNDPAAKEKEERKKDVMNNTSDKAIKKFRKYIEGKDPYSLVSVNEVKRKFDEIFGENR